MLNQKSHPPRICVLTQTASEIRPYYHQFFAGLDIHFVTFKQRNPAAVDFLPGSTWSDGRNRLWEHVKGQYDYYLFIDDDLEFFCLPTDTDRSGFLIWLLQKKVRWQERLHLRGIVTRLIQAASEKKAELTRYEKADPARFRKLLVKKLTTYRPMVASVALTLDDLTAFHLLDRRVLDQNRRVRPIGWFDAQVTLFSNVGASLLLPYDTQISGWWSSQIPIYVLGRLAFQDKAINILDVATRNMNTSVYRPGYDGIQDCLTMSEWLTSGILEPGREPINMEDGSFIDHFYASEFCSSLVKPAISDPTLESALATLGESFDLHHPYIYERHKGLVDALSMKQSGERVERVHG